MDSSKAAYEWDRKNTTGVYLKLQNRTDSDIIDLLNSLQNRQGYIKQLIRADMQDKKIFHNFMN